MSRFLRPQKNDHLSGDVLPLDISSAKIARFLVAVLAVQSDVTSRRVSMNETMSLKEAARYLKLSQEALRRKAKAGVIPGAKLGKSWVFYQPDLVDYLRSRYPHPRQASQSGKETALCHSIDVKPSGGSASRPLAESEYADLLGLREKMKPRSTTTASKRKSGKPSS